MATAANSAKESRQWIEREPILIGLALAGGIGLYAMPDFAGMTASKPSGPPIPEPLAPAGLDQAAKDAAPQFGPAAALPQTKAVPAAVPAKPPEATRIAAPVLPVASLPVAASSHGPVHRRSFEFSQPAARPVAAPRIPARTLPARTIRVMLPPASPVPMRPSPAASESVQAFQPVLRVELPAATPVLPVIPSASTPIAPMPAAALTPAASPVPAEPLSAQPALREGLPLAPPDAAIPPAQPVQQLAAPEQPAATPGAAAYDQQAENQPVHSDAPVPAPPEAPAAAQPQEVQDKSVTIDIPLVPSATGSGKLPLRIAANGAISIPLDALLELARPGMNRARYKQLRASPAARQVIGLGALRASGLRFGYDMASNTVLIDAVRA